ncbi:hypothetical protein [Telluribacter sp.]|jgi:rod shape-determining protein MreD|uniref:hypothetical protein n=1 Tax=Telluribacter sp. TaxID=1978767 RepID=UPI002E0EA4EF|nr:hypothetical protein [Telluribacter sp.]
MSLREIVQYSLWFLLYLALQILVMRNLVLFDYAFCFVYIAGVLLLPAETNRTALLLIGFVTGIAVDVFYNTLGMHAAATLLVAYLRPALIRLQFEAKGADRTISIQALGIGSYITFLFSLVLVHHSALFLIEMSHFGMVLYTLLRIVASSIFTTVVILLFQFFSRR